MTEDVHVAPDWVSPPGDTIDDLLEERCWVKADLAQRSGLTTEHVDELVNGRASISADVAERLALVLGSTSDFWLARDARYRAAIERRARPGPALTGRGRG